jgi:PAS domain S-box-containing protein
MAEDDEQASQVQKLLDTPHLADALESEQFRHFLDQMPIALIVSSLEEGERIIYANPEFEKLSGQGAQDIEGKSWTALRGADAARDLGEAIESAADFIGTFRIERAPGEVVIADAYSNVIEDEDGAPAFRLAALVDVGAHQAIDRESLELRIREKDTQMRELQHRVKNNLQMITALIRLEARNAPPGTPTAHFDRLAGRIEALHLLYRALSDADVQEIDLGVYLSEIASAAMRAHATEGIRLNLKVDAYPVSLNVAMPAGLIVNELLTNALKHAFVGRDGGTITLHSLADEKGCRVVVADDGVGFPEGVTWPKRGKLGALIVQSLRENAKAGLEFETAPGKGSSVTMVFTRAAAAPERSGEMNSDERK